MKADPPMMMCGHAANALDIKTNRPSCVICMSTRSDLATTINPDYSFEKREARCAYDQPGAGGGGKYRKHTDGDSITPARMSLAFFESKPNEKWDRYYCGCWGWD